MRSMPARRFFLVLALVAAACLPATARAQAAAPLPPALLPAPVRPLEPDQGLAPPSQAPAPSIIRRPAAQPRTPVELTDEDLRKNVRLTERILNQAMLQQDWSTLRRIMGFYPWMQGVDPILRDYVHGALLRHEGRYAQAIALYRRLLDLHPDLDYVRLELAMMLMENKAFDEAGAQIGQLSTRPLDPAARHDVESYRRALERQRGWQFRLGAGLAYNDNVNSANPDRLLYLPLAFGTQTIWVPFAKQSDALPKADWGLKYSGEARIERNIRGNHYYTFGADVSGVAYRRMDDYDDRSLTLRGGYKHQDFNAWFAATPQVGRAWLGDQPYSRNYGLSLEYGYQPTPSWQLMASWLWLKRRYDDPAYAAYDGHLDILSLTALRVVSPSLLVFGSLGLQRESVAAGEYSYRSPWVQVGAVKTFGKALGARLSGRYGWQSYDEPYALFLNQRRRDRELRLDASLWVPGFSIGGLEPRFNVSHLRITGNLPMYERSRTEVSLMFEKRF